MEITDQLGRNVRVERPPRRIVSLVPSLTELLFDLGVGERVVGRTKFCTRPAAALERVPRIGGTKGPRRDAVAEVRPDFILANREENRREDVEALAGEAPVYVSDIAWPEAALHVVRALGALLDVDERAAELVQRLSDAYGSLPDLAGRRVAYLIWQNPIMVAGGGTYVDTMIRLCGAINVFGSRERYPEVDAEELRRSGAEEWWLSSEPFPFRALHATELARMSSGAAIRLVDGEAFSWYGTRVLHAGESFAALLQEPAVSGVSTRQ